MLACRTCDNYQKHDLNAAIVKTFNCYVLHFVHAVQSFIGVLTEQYSRQTALIDWIWTVNIIIVHYIDSKMIIVLLYVSKTAAVAWINTKVLRQSQNLCSKLVQDLVPLGSYIQKGKHIMS